MNSKRKHSAGDDHAGKKSKKSNIDTEITPGTSSAYLAENQRATMSVIDLNKANLQEKISGMPSTWFDGIYAVGLDIVDLTLTSCSSESTVISLSSQQDSDDEASGDSSSTITACSSFNDYSDDELCISNNIDTTQHPNTLQNVDEELNDINSKGSTSVTDDEERNNSHSKLTASIYTNNGFACNCGGPCKNYTDNGVKTSNDIGATGFTNTLQYRDDEINATRSESSIDSVSQQNNGCNNYYRTQYYGETYDNEYKIGSENLTAVTLTSQQNNGYDDNQATNDEEIIYSPSKTTLESSTAMTSVSQHDINEHYQSQNYEKTNDNHSKLTACIYTYNCTFCNCGGPSKNDSDNKVRITNKIDNIKHINTSQCRYDENMNKASSTGTLRGSTAITSVREQENGYFVYLTEYDEAMNEIYSDVIKIEKPTMPNLVQIGSFIVMSSGQHPNGYNRECTHQSSISSEHVNVPRRVTIYSLMRDVEHPSVNDETRPTEFTFIKL